MMRHSATFCLILQESRITTLLVLTLAELALGGKCPDLIISKDDKTINLDLDCPQTAPLVVLLGSKQRSLTIRCDPARFQVPTLQGFTLMQICASHNAPFLRTKCISVSKDANFQRGVLEKNKWIARWDENQGTLMTLYLNSTVLPMVYLDCRMNSEWGLLRSNRLEIWDFRKNFPKSIWERKEHPTLNRNSASTFKCLPRSLGIKEKLENEMEEADRRPAFSVNFDWLVCSSPDMSRCMTTLRPIMAHSTFSKWPAQVRADGELYLPFVPDEIVERLNSNYLVCSIDEKPVTIYSKSIIVVSKGTKKPVPLAMVRPKAMENIVLYNSSSYELRLPCLFNTSASVTVRWKYNNKIVLKVGEDSSRKITVSADQEVIIFKGQFTDATTGNYSCHVAIAGGGGDSVSGTYAVIVKRSPVFLSNIPPVMYAVEGQNRSVNCGFKRQQGMKATLVIGTEVINTADESRYTKQVMDYMDFNGIDPSYVMIVNPGKEVLRYMEFKIKYKKPLEHIYLLTCVGNLAPFQVIRKIYFGNFAKPEPMFNFTIPKNCSCSCNLTCNLNNRAELEERGVILRASWLIQNASATAENISSGEGVNFSYTPTKNATVKFRCTLKMVVRTSDTTFYEFTRVSDKVLLRACKSSKSYTNIVVIVVILLIVAAVTVAVVIIVLRKKRQRRRRRRNRLDGKGGAAADGSENVDMVERERPDDPST